jgi:protein SCO1/2
MKRSSFYIAASILVVPIIVFLVLDRGKTNTIRLAYFGNRIEPNGADVKDTIYYTIPNFNVTDQTGQELSLANFDGQIFVANFFFASCKDVCPRMNSRLKKVYDKSKEYAEVKFISFTVDPNRDTTSVLAAYANKFGADSKIWHFARTDKESLFKIGQGFLLPVSIEDRTIDHSQQVLLIDKEKHIRGIYNGLEDDDMKRLGDEIKVLLIEYDDKRNGK